MVLNDVVPDAERKPRGLPTPLREKNKFMLLDAASEIFWVHNFESWSSVYSICDNRSFFINQDISFLIKLLTAHTQWTPSFSNSYSLPRWSGAFQDTSLWSLGWSRSSFPEGQRGQVPSHCVFFSLAFQAVLPGGGSLGSSHSGFCSPQRFCSVLRNSPWIWSSSTFSYLSTFPIPAVESFVAFAVS